MDRDHPLAVIARLARCLLVSVGLAVAGPAAAWANTGYSVIYEFRGGAHGINPEAGVILGPAGSVFGTTDTDGINAGGVVFQLFPAAVANERWTERILKRFPDLAQGGYPLGLTWTAAGVLYGVTFDGGGTANGAGTLFQLTPPPAGYTNWSFATLHRFRGGNDGSRPAGSVIVDATGALSGTTILGGSGPGLDGYGVVYSLAPSRTDASDWTEKIQHRFTSSPDGATPDGALLPLSTSVRYGVTTTGGTGVCSDVGCGTVFEMAETAHGWKASVIYQFQGGADGSSPIDRLVADDSGSLYGATADGGMPGPDGTYVTGTVFRLDPPGTGARNWTKAILYAFQGSEDGYSPQGGVTLDPNGALYGTTEFGGTQYRGTVYKLTPNAPGQPWTKTILHDFGGVGDGAYPTGHVTLDDAGTIFGTTWQGGSTNDGTVYRITQ